MRRVGEKQLQSLTEKFEYYEAHGQDEACKHFGITPESLNRRIREYKAVLRLLDGPKVPKVLIFDLETSYMQGLFFSTFKPIIHHSNIQTHSHLHSWAGKWLNEPEVFGDVQTSKEASNHDDKRITKSLWKVMDQADVVVAHNLKKFDRKVANARFILNGLNPPSPYQQIDTLLIARSQFKFASNRLDFLGQIMVSDEKIHTNNKLWIDCFNGKEEALAEMYTYNKQDVNLLEEVYYELRPWMPSHPNMAIVAESVKESCPVCLSTDLRERGEYLTPGGRFDSLTCGNCGAVSRRRETNLSKDQKENLLMSVAR